MLTNLLKYEFVKKWKSMKYILLGYTIIQVILLAINRVLLSRSGNSILFNYGAGTASENMGFSLGVSLVFYFLLILLICIFPFFEGVTRYEKDLSGKQAPLELMIPLPSWKKILSKVISTVGVSIICWIIALASVVIFILIMNNFNQEMIGMFVSFIKLIFGYPFSLLFTIIYAILSYASFYLLLFFCTAVAKAITHKNKLSVFIAIVTFGVLLAAMGYISFKIENYPIVNFEFFKGLTTGAVSSLSSILLDVTSLILIFLGTSYIMEKKIEF